MGEWSNGDKAHVWVVFCEDEGECNWVRLVVGWEWLRPHAENAGCRSDEDMAGVHD